jgi:ankyrin repeat protein
LRRDGSPLARFEAAADAIVAGDLATLDRLLTGDPALVHARSPRTHRSALVHYVAANGVEYFRQRTPANIVAVANRVLDAGADINATADLYGGNATTFGLFATGIMPVLAGVLEDGLQLLIDRGASIESGAALINSCHANGRPEAAEWLAARGLDLDLEAAAGVGRLDVVQRFFTESGALQNATPDQMRRGFAWACEYGKSGVVEFLLHQGMDVGTKLPNHGQTGLHWAAGSGYADVARVLLDHGASVHAQDDAFGVTPLAWALYGWGEGPRRSSTADDYYAVVQMLVSAGSVVDPQWIAHERVQADPQMHAALTEK